MRPPAASHHKSIAESACLCPDFYLLCNEPPQAIRALALCLSVDEMGDVLGVSRASAYDLVKREGFPAVIIGRRILIPISSLERWLEEQAANSKAV